MPIQVQLWDDKRVKVISFCLVQTFHMFFPPKKLNLDPATCKNWNSRSSASGMFGSNTSSHKGPWNKNLNLTCFLITLQGTNISHLGKRKIIFKSAIFGGYVNSLEGNICDPILQHWRSIQQTHDGCRIISDQHRIISLLRRHGETHLLQFFNSG